MGLQLALVAVFIHGALAACRSGWIQHDTSCYHVSRENETWVDAMNVCTTFHGYLVEIGDARENNFLKGLMETRTLYHAWIGASDLMVEGEWLWAHSDQPVTFTNWHTGQPNDYLNDEHCAQMWHNGTWNDFMCHGFLHYICESPPSDAVPSVIG